MSSRPQTGPLAEIPGQLPLLGLAMIVKNGEQLFTELLAEASPWVDEIVVGDTGSTDGSAQAVIACGGRLLDIPWQDDFSASRNQVLRHCTARWILILDADEKIAPADWRELRRWVQEGEQSREPRAVRLETRNYLEKNQEKRGWRPLPDPDAHRLPEDPPASGYVPSLKVRLFPNYRDIVFQGCLHETVEASVLAAGLTTVELALPIHHFGLLEDNPGKNQRYLLLARTKVRQEPRHARAWSELADCAAACGQIDEAIAALDQALILEPANIDNRLLAGRLLLERGRPDLADIHLSAVAGSKGINDEQLATACHWRARIALQTDHPERVPQLLAIALRLDPLNGHLYNTLGAWHLREGRGPAAEKALTRAVALSPTRVEPLLNLMTLYQAADQLQPGADCARRVLELDPRNPAARRVLKLAEKMPAV